MRRNARILITIFIIVAICGTILGVQNLEIGNFQRGGNTLLGLTLGLDLQGGSHLVYKADLEDSITGEDIEVSDDQMRALVRTIERRINASGLGEPILQILGEDRLLVQLPGIKDPGRAKDLIGETARLEFKHRIINVQPEPVESLKPSDIISIKADDLREDGKIMGLLTAEELMEEAMSTSTEPMKTTPALVIEFTPASSQLFRDLVVEMNTSLAEALMAQQNNDYLPADTLGVNITGNEELRFQTLGNNIMQLGTSTRYMIALPTEGSGAEGSMTSESIAMKLGSSPQMSFERLKGYIDEDIGLTGDDLKTAYPSQHQGSGLPIVSIEFDDRGTKIFGELTTKIYSKLQDEGISDQIVIILDGEELISPVVQTPITAGTAIIDGPGFTIDSVKDLSLLLESGRLPVPIELIQERDVDAILGSDSLRKSVIAGLVGLGLVLAFMTIYYRVPGLVASLALIIYAAMVLTIFKILPVTLTLSGVAAVILSIGMAVDANILIFERMKDELRSGRTMLSAINIGFNRAWPAIRDGNVSTLITCAILYWFSDQLGATIVQGFAVTLAIGVLISMFSAIVISRSFLRVIAATPISRNLRLFLPSGGKEISS